MYNSSNRVNVTCQCGVSLIETMVGMTIGIAISLAVVQVWGSFENQKQITISGASIQNTGAVSITEIEQDLRSAGAGLTISPAFNCSTIYSYYEKSGVKINPAPAYAGSMGLAPVTIQNGGTGSDQITIKASYDSLSGIPATLTQSMPQSSSELNVSSISGFSTGDLVLAVGAAGNCTLMELTQVQAAAQKIQHNPGNSVTYNPTVSDQNTWGWPGYTSNDQIVKVGQLISHRYSVNTQNQLVLTDLTDPIIVTNSVITTDIVSIKAQYGVANSGSQDVSVWLSPLSSNGFDVLNSSKVKRIKAIRIAIVARSSKLNGVNVTDTCTSSTGNINKGPCVWSDTTGSPAPVIDLSTDANWQKYRYSVYQTIVPLKNVIWAGV